MKFLIFNADDFGYGRGINRGIAEAPRPGRRDLGHADGERAGHRTRRWRWRATRPRLSLGLHVNFTNEAQRLVEFDDPAVCRRELRRQFDRFVRADRPAARPISTRTSTCTGGRSAAAASSSWPTEHGLPLRDRPPVTFKGGFYGAVGVRRLRAGEGELRGAQRILRHRAPRAASTSWPCHPGYLDAAADYVYHRDRECELRDPVRSAPARRCCATRRSSSSATTSSGARSRASTAAARPERGRRGRLSAGRRARSASRTPPRSSCPGSSPPDPA